MTRDATRWHDEIALREASLADARRELDSGELSPAEYARIEERESRRLTDARRELEVIAAAPATVPTTRRHRARYLWIAGGCFIAALGLILWASLVPRQAGTSDTGSVQLGRTQQVQQLLLEAEADTASGHDVTALVAYRDVLALDADDVAALTQTGWLEFSAGSAARDPATVAAGVADLRRAINLAPRQAAPHLYYAIVAASTRGNAKLARAQFEIFLALKPSSGQMAVAAPFLKGLGLKY